MRVAEKLQVYYRGCLQFCNYACSYCPFCKKTKSENNIKRDKEQLMRFVDRMEQLSFSGAVQIIPYGEGMIHDYYWDALAKLSRLPGVDRVGIQSNFSFSVDGFVTRLQREQAKLEKICLWGTFHPEQTTVSAFQSQCHRLQKAGIRFSVGVVGVPGQMETIQELRDAIPKESYMWINALEGAGRPYSQEEKEEFRKIDPFFEQELRRLPADVEDCGGTYFVRGDGRMYACPISQVVIGDFYQIQTMEELYEMEKKRTCRSRFCHCHLAYNNRKKESNQMFGSYPAFRIPFLPKAIFLDIDGVLVKAGERRISQKTEETLRSLSVHFPLYLATSRPLKEAVKVLGTAMHDIKGGAFSCGAQLLLWQQQLEKKDREIYFEKIYELREDSFLQWLQERCEEKKTDSVK